MRPTTKTLPCGCYSGTVERIGHRIADHGTATRPPMCFIFCRPLHLRRPMANFYSVMYAVPWLIFSFLSDKSHKKRHTNNDLIQSASKPNLTFVKGWWDIDDKHLTAILAAGCVATMHQWMQLLLHTSTINLEGV